MRDLRIVRGGAVAMNDGKISAVGTIDEVLQSFEGAEVFDAGDNVVCPAFVDPHTHIVYAGDRLDEFELKIKGAEYLEILDSGGGIISTVKKTRAANFNELVEQSMRRLNQMLACGTATVEVKTGYGLDLDTELKMLRVIEELHRKHVIDMVPTFLGAHAIPREYVGNADEYVEKICEEMLLEIWNWYTTSKFFAEATPCFVDVFCEKGAFSLEQSLRVLRTAKDIGFELKAHVDEFTNLGGSRLAIEMGATSIDHLDAISDAEIALLAKSSTIGVVTPTVNFNFGSAHFADARKMIDAGCAIAISTDYNPGSAPCPSQPMAMAIACRYQKLSPAEALNAATINSAFAVGLGDQTGSIEVGKNADILVLESGDYRDLAYEFGGNLINTVLLSGKQAYPANGR